jgi:hypothetical protein
VLRKEYREVGRVWGIGGAPCMGIVGMLGENIEEILIFRLISAPASAPSMRDMRIITLAKC